VEDGQLLMHVMVVDIVLIYTSRNLLSRRNIMLSAASSQTHSIRVLGWLKENSTTSLTRERTGAKYDRCSRIANMYQNGMSFIGGSLLGRSGVQEIDANQME
jgi:hypothetical protein